MRLNLSLRSLLPAALLLTAVTLALPLASSGQIILTIGIAPPALPIYVQPVCPSAGYMWTPGYWAYAQEGYFWVPGTWVMAPEPGLLWTPGYWGWGESAFQFHEGYWGAHIGFYGGVNYGFGYAGVGYQGGYWNNGAFFYNRSVNNVSHVTNVYSKTVIVNRETINNVSYNGGTGGISARPSAEEQTADNEKHVERTSVQTQHVQAASTNHQLYESVNHGKPAVAATAKPGEFSGRGVVAAKAAAPSYKPATARAGAPSTAAASKDEKAEPRPAAAVHAKDITPPARTGNVQPTKLDASQQQQRQKLQQKQDQDHQRLAATKPSAASQQQLEQKHQQQTQQLEQKHLAQQQKAQPKQPVAHKPPQA